MADGLVVFDLDGTLLRPATACEVMAAQLGRADEMRAFEGLRSQGDIAHARAVMASWNPAVALHELAASITEDHFAPGARVGIERLRASGVEVGIASITWEFAVSSCARRLGVDRWLGTVLGEDHIEHCWPEHKPTWARRQLSALGLPADRLAAVGDSHGDLPLLRTAPLALYMGADAPAELPTHACRLPGARIDEVAGVILAHWHL